ncbi:Trk system potassium uptake protein TrkA [subsurface metagenome]
MYIVVVGGGRLGYYLAKALLNEGHEVVIVEKNATFCKIINDELGGVCIHGDGCEIATLAELGTSRADMLIAVTGDDEDNLVACQVAKHKFNVSRTIARIRNPQNEAIFKKLGIDVTVSSTNVILEHIQEEVPTHPLTHLLSIRDQGLEVVEIKIPPKSTAVGKRVKELSLPEGTRLALVIHLTQKPKVPTADTIIRAEDRIIAITSSESEEKLRAILRGT